MRVVAVAQAVDQLARVADAVEFVRQVLEAVVGLADRGGVEGIGLYDIRPGGKVLPVNGADHIRSGEHQDIVIPLERQRMSGESVPAEILFGQFPALDHGSHGSVKDHNPFIEYLFNRQKRCALLHGYRPYLA